MIQQDPILQPLIFLRITHRQQIAQRINLQLVKILVDSRIQQALELDNTSADFRGRCFFRCRFCCVCCVLGVRVSRSIGSRICCSGRKAKLFFRHIEQCSFDFANGLVGEFVDGIDNVVEECLCGASVTESQQAARRQRRNSPRAYSGNAQSAAPS